MMDNLFFKVKNELKKIMHDDLKVHNANLRFN